MPRIETSEAEGPQRRRSWWSAWPSLGRREVVLVVLAGCALVEGSGFHIGRDGSLVHLGGDAPKFVGGPPHPTVPRMPPGQRGLPGPQMHLPLQTGEASSPRVVLWSTDGFAKVTTGIGSVEPRAYTRLKDEMRGFPDRVSIARLRALRVRVVVLHPDLVGGTPWKHTAERSVKGLPLRCQDGGGVVVYRRLPRATATTRSARTR